MAAAEGRNGFPKKYKKYSYPRLLHKG